MFPSGPLETVKKETQRGLAHSSVAGACLAGPMFILSTRDRVDIKYAQVLDATSNRPLKVPHMMAPHMMAPHN